MTARSMKRIAGILIGILLVGCFVWQFPLFHIAPLSESQVGDYDARFDAKHVTKAFWNGALRESFDQAAEATAVIAAIRESPQSAREQFGKTVGLSRGYHFYLRGSGTIVSMEPHSIGLALDEGAATSRQLAPDVQLTTGFVFGNAVRDATGLIRSSDYANSQHFNAISTELNHIVETEVLPPLEQHAVVGQRIYFVGCAEVVNEARDLKPLRVVPIHVEFENVPDVETNN